MGEVVLRNIFVAIPAINRPNAFDVKCDKALLLKYNTYTINS